jgi:flagellar biosynthesis/type III secretory pathway chaperone
MTHEAEDLMSDGEKKSRLTSQLDAATKRYREASEAGNLDAKKSALNDMRAYRKKIFKLMDEVKNKNEGELPTWWNE